MLTQTDARQSQRLLARVRLLALDVDGVLTDGRIILGSNRQEFKAFDVKDGLGLKLLMDSGVQVGVITGRTSAAIEWRCRELGIDAVHSAVADKAQSITAMCKKYGLAPSSAGFIGDDLPDLPAMRRVGLAIAVADAHPQVKAAAHIVTQAAGGCGAVREICEALLAAQGRWQAILERFLTDREPVESIG